MRILLLLAAIVFLSSCSDSGMRQYSNPEIGLSMSFPTSWKVLNQSQLRQTANSAYARSNNIPKEDMEAIIPYTIFNIAKPQIKNGKSRNPNMMVLAIPTSSEDCKSVGAPSYVESEEKAYISAYPNISPAPTAHVNTATHTNGYTVFITLKDRVVTQHRYFYCIGNNVVLIQTSSSTPKDEDEVRKILSSARVIAQSSNNSLKP